MNTLAETLAKTKVGDLFESGQMFKFSKEPLVWVVEDIYQEGLDMIDIVLSMNLYDVFVCDVDLSLVHNGKEWLICQ
jgi:hypothetical protein